MTCARYRALISRYLDDELTPRQRAELLAHIEHCASCAADLARYRRTELLLRKQPEGLTEHDPKRGSVRDIRRQGEARRRGLRWALAGRLRGRSVVAVCTLLVLVLLPLAYSGLSAPTGGQGISAKFGFQSPAS